jgi:hypothetical protein
MYDERYGIRQINRYFLDFLVELDEAVDFIPKPWKYEALSSISGIFQPSSMHRIAAEAGTT